MAAFAVLAVLAASLAPAAADENGPALTIDAPIGVVAETANVAFAIEGIRQGEDPWLELRVYPLDHAPGRMPELSRWTPGTAVEGERVVWSQEELPDGWRVNRTFHFVQDGRYRIDVTAGASTPDDHRVTRGSFVLEASLGHFGWLVSDATALPAVMNHTQERVPFDAVVHTSFVPRWATAELVLSNFSHLSLAEAAIEALAQDDDGYTVRLTGWIDYAPDVWDTPSLRKSHSGTHRVDITYTLGSGGLTPPAYVGGAGQDVRILEELTQGPAPPLAETPPEPDPQPLGAPPIVPVAGGVVATLALALVFVTESGRHALLRLPVAGLVIGRLAGGDVLAHRRRKHLMAAIRKEPGIGFGELRRRLGWANGVLSHHLHILEGAGHVRATRRGTRLHFHEPEATRPPLPATQRAILERLDQGWVGTQTTLAAELGISRQAVHANVHEMEQAGLVRLENDGARTRVVRPPGEPRPGPG